LPVQFQTELRSTEHKKASDLHVLTLTPFYPSAEDETNGCFIAEGLQELQSLGTRSSVVAISSIYHSRRSSSGIYPCECVRYPCLPGNFGLSTAGRFLCASLLARIRELHRHAPIHVIHAHAALPCGDAARLVSQTFDIPFVVTVHGLDVFNSCFEHGIAAAWRKKTSIRVYKHARKVICISEKVRRILAYAAGPAVSADVIYNGTDASIFAPACAENLAVKTPSILTVGNLLIGKGHELVLKAIARLKDSHPTLQCHIIGEGSDRARFANLARDLAIGNRVHFHGCQSRAAVAEAMRNCTLFVLPSRYEGLGCVYLEAMASAKPVIACRGQGIDEIIEHGNNGWLIPVDGEEELVQGLKILLGNHELRSRIGRAARDTIVRRFTLAHQAESLLKIYQEAAR
jgi:teichuronic acid biosynthesis glycosyltransferase TuaC